MRCENCGIKLTVPEWLEHLSKKNLRGYDEKGNCLSCGKSVKKNAMEKLKETE